MKNEEIVQSEMQCSVECRWKSDRTHKIRDIDGSDEMRCESDMGVLGVMRWIG